MSLLNAVLLGILQGITEFLPISSSGHLIIAEQWLGLQVNQLESFDVAVHVGTLLAIAIYFWQDWKILIQSFFGYFFNLLRGKKALTSNHHQDKSQPQFLFHPLYFIVATIPAIIAGLLLSDVIQNNLRQAKTVAIFLVLAAGYFVFAEYIKKHRPEKEIGFKQALIIGIAQACALLPGVSRSGATIATSLVLGVSRERAARFSFLLGGIAIFAGALLAIIKTLKGDFMLPNWDILITGIVTSFVAGLASIAFLMKFLKKHSLLWFAAYRVILGLTILWFWLQ